MTLQENQDEHNHSHWQPSLPIAQPLTNVY